MLINELKEIVKIEKDVVSFLKSLSLNRKEKTAFVKEVKELRNIVFERKDSTKKTKWGIEYSSNPTHSDQQQQTMNLVCFLLYNKTDARRIFSNNNFLISKKVINEILPWFAPKWYSDLVNEANPWDLDYDLLIYLQEQEYLEPSKELIIAKLPNAIVDSTWVDGVHKVSYKPEVLLRNEVTLETHIWYLFEEDSGINFLDVWIKTIVDFTSKGHLNRKKVLIATIYTATKGFNQTLSGWFFELLLKLNPTKEEVLMLQDELFSALNSPHSKVVNTVLKYFKIAAIAKEFKYIIFIENASILLSSEVKSVVNSTLMILDKIAKTHKSLQIDICKKATEALLNTDEKIQVRAAKIINKYGDATNEELAAEIEMYTDALLYASKEIISDYIHTDPTELEDDISETVEMEVLSEHTRLPVYETFDDLIFFVSQVLANNEMYHIDLLLMYLPKLNLLITKDNASRLAPILKRAFDLSFSHEWNSQIGYIESMAALYINDLGKEIVKKYPTELSNFWKYRDKKFKEDTWRNGSKKEYLRRFESHSIPYYVYNLHRFLFAYSLGNIRNKRTIPVLSTPTHAPCWIAPEVFLDRMLDIQKQGGQFNLYDFQIGLGRIPLTEMTTEISRKIDQINEKEIRLVLRYHFGGIDFDNCKIIESKFWLQSILTRKNPANITRFETITSTNLQFQIAMYEWSCKPRENTYKVYDYQSRKDVKKTIIEKQLKFNNFIRKTHTYSSPLEKIKNFFNKKVNKKAFDDDNIYKFIYFKREQYVTTILAHDDIKFLYLAPNNPGPYLAQIIHNNMKESKFYDENSKKNMVNVLKGLYEIWYRKDYSETTYLFLATGFLCSDKVAREIAAEIWIKTTSEHTMNHTLLGYAIGKLQFGEYAPMKRFTDIFGLNMFNISKTHNLHLFELTDAIIKEMNDTPMRGLKKLLELFLELKRKFPNIDISVGVTQKLRIWKTSKTLEKVIEKLI
ncbi:DUF6493 family protein [uncultured Kordia sp.]|uniref:DUF6493 family protein n=1 Tax=uncultured Kordia sp. TaxID=507699 RepID=UPI00262539D7|nr:DUF6493 family protein [uncultured Kordia sp.]